MTVRASPLAGRDRRDHTDDELVHLTPLAKGVIAHLEPDYSKLGCERHAERTTHAWLLGRPQRGNATAAQPEAESHAGA